MSNYIHFEIKFNDFTQDKCGMKNMIKFFINR